MVEPLELSHKKEKEDNSFSIQIAESDYSFLTKTKENNLLIEKFIPNPPLRGISS